MQDRRPNGQWLPGVSGNPNGRQKLSVEDRLFRIMASRVSDEDWKTIVDRQVTKARSGALPSATWIADRLMGKPVERTENKNIGMSVEEWARLLDEDDGEDESGKQSDTSRA